MSDALRIADDQGFDLVEIAPSADPPVCKIMDYGKFKYEQAMKAKQARKHQTKVEIKEIKFRPKIDKHDYETKKRHVVRFLEAGAKVKITIMFRGRELLHPERGEAILLRLAEELKDIALIESRPNLDGRNMVMMIAPLKNPVVAAESGSGEDAPAEPAEPATATTAPEPAAPAPEPAEHAAPAPEPAEAEASTS